MPDTNTYVYACTYQCNSMHLSIFHVQHMLVRMNICTHTHVHSYIIHTYIYTFIHPFVHKHFTPQIIGNYWYI